MTKHEELQAIVDDCQFTLMEVSQAKGPNLWAVDCWKRDDAGAFTINHWCVYKPAYSEALKEYRRWVKVNQ